MTDEVEIKDFSYDSVTIPFRIGEDVFHAHPDIPLSVVGQISKLTDVRGTLEKENGVNVITDVFAEFLQDASGELFRQRVHEKKIGVKKITEILPWILEKYGLRPTQPSSDSPSGLGDGETGTSSTDGVPLEESIL